MSCWGIFCHQSSAEQFVSGTLRSLFGQLSMTCAASTRNFETGNLSGFQSRRLTDYYITEESNIRLGRNCGQKPGRYEMIVEPAGNHKE